VCPIPENSTSFLEWASLARLLPWADGAGLTGLQILPGALFGVAKSDAVTLDIPGVNGSLGVWNNFAVSGNAGIGTSDPGAKLDVRGDIRLGATGQHLVPGGDQNLQIQCIPSTRMVQPRRARPFMRKSSGRDNTRLCSPAG
jgi:hypothetical protein